MQLRFLVTPPMSWAPLVGRVGNSLMSPGSSNGSVVVEHEVVMEANFTPKFQELFENLTKIINLKLTNETRRLSSDSQECKGEPT